MKLFEKRLARLESKKEALVQRAMASTDADEVRSINEQIADLNAEIEETREMLETEAEETRALPPTDAKLVNGNILGAFGQKTEEKREETETTSDMEYRSAFMAYVQKGTPMTKRNGEVISTAETGAAIPMTVMNEVINTVRKRYGNLYARVRKIAVKGGIEFPVGALQATFKWISISSPGCRQARQGIFRLPHRRDQDRSELPLTDPHTLKLRGKTCRGYRCSLLAGYGLRHRQRLG